MCGLRQAVAKVADVLSLALVQAVRVLVAALSYLLAKAPRVVDV
jgi:hypothetical protein